MDHQEPAAQVLGGLVRGIAIEWHQRGRSPWQARDLCAPLAHANARYLDEVFAAVDGFFETMNVHSAAGSEVCVVVGTRAFYPLASADQAKETSKAHSHGAPRRFARRSGAK